jgi:DNA (cytosine-5)-methyltransferase 1
MKSGRWLPAAPSYILPPHLLKYFDTFAGIGGFALALNEFGHEAVGFSEIDRYAIQIYRSHFPSHTPYGDITALDLRSLPAFDLL